MGSSALASLGANGHKTGVKSRAGTLALALWHGTWAAQVPSEILQQTHSPAIPFLSYFPHHRTNCTMYLDCLGLYLNVNNYMQQNKLPLYDYVFSMFCFYKQHQVFIISWVHFIFTWLICLRGRKGENVFPLTAWFPKCLRRLPPVPGLPCGQQELNYLHYHHCSAGSAWAGIWDWE